MVVRTKDLDKQRRMKEAMVRLILREGIDGASVSKIAREAGVSPATIYIYYSSKEEMLSEVFQEYAHQGYRYLMHRLRPGMEAGELIEAIVRGYFEYTVQYEEVFSFVEQCSRCPTLSQRVSEEECCGELFSLLHEYQSRGQLRPWSDPNLAAILFSPVRFLALNRDREAQTPEAQLGELIEMLRRVLLL